MLSRISRREGNRFSHRVSGRHTNQNTDHRTTLTTGPGTRDRRTSRLVGGTRSLVVGTGAGPLLDGRQPCPVPVPTGPESGGPVTVAPSEVVSLVDPQGSRIGGPSLRVSGYGRGVPGPLIHRQSPTSSGYLPRRSGLRVPINPRPRPWEYWARGGR